MTLPYASVSVAPSETDSRLRGWRLMVARAVWLVVSLLSVTLFVASVPAFYREAVTLSGDVSGSDVGPETLRAGLAELGLSSAFYGGYFVALMCIFVPVYWAVGALIFWRRSDERMALLVSLWLVVFGALFNPSCPQTDSLIHLHMAVTPLAGDDLLTGIGSWLIPTTVVEEAQSPE